MLSINLAVSSNKQSKGPRGSGNNVHIKKKKLTKLKLKKELEDGNRDSFLDVQRESIRSSKRKSSDRIKEMIRTKKIQPGSLVDVFLSGRLKEKLSRRLDRSLYALDITILIIALLGLVTFIWENEIYYRDIHLASGIKILKGKEVDSFTLVEKDENLFCSFLRIVVLLTTLSFDILLFVRYQLMLKYKKIILELDNNDTLFSTKMIYFLFIEISLCLIISYPTKNRVGKVNFTSKEPDSAFLIVTMNLLVTFSSLGFFMFGEYGRTFQSLIKNWRKNFACFYCKSYLSNAKGGIKFAVKAEIHKNPFLVVGTGVLACSMIFGYSLRTAERTFQFFSGLNWEYIWNGMWCIQTLITTVGYGDFFPSTHFGRIIVTFVCLFGSFIISLVNVGMQNILAFNKSESRAFEKIKAHDYYKEYENLAANVVQTLFRFFVAIKRLEPDRRNSSSISNSMQYLFPNLKMSLINFQNKRKLFIYLKANKRIDEIIPKKLKLFQNELFAIKSSIQTVNSILSKINKIEVKNQLIIDSLDKEYNRVYSFQKDLYFSFRSNFQLNVLNEIKPPELLLSEEVITRKSFLKPMTFVNIRSNLRRTSDHLKTLILPRHSTSDYEPKELSSPLKRIRDRKVTSIKQILIKEDKKPKDNNEMCLKVEVKRDLLTADEILQTISARRKKSTIPKKKISYLGNEPPPLSAKRFSRMNSKIYKSPDSSSIIKNESSNFLEEKQPVINKTTLFSLYSKDDSFRKSISSGFDKGSTQDVNIPRAEEAQIVENENKENSESSKSSLNDPRSNNSFECTLKQNINMKENTDIIESNDFSLHDNEGFLPGFIGVESKTFAHDSKKEGI